jgi:hypothetical protein
MYSTYIKSTNTPEKKMFKSSSVKTIHDVIADLSNEGVIDCHQVFELGNSIGTEDNEGMLEALQGYIEDSYKSDEEIAFFQKWLAESVFAKSI